MDGDPECGQASIGGLSSKMRSDLKPSRWWANGLMSNRNLEKNTAPSASFWNWLGSVILVAIAYPLVGHLGLKLWVTSDQVALVWPATGVAVAALLIGGLRLWPGVFLGVLILVYSALGFSVTLHAFATATGNVIEASLTAYLMRRLAGFHGRFEDQRSVFAFLLFGGLLSSPISATFGVLSAELSDFHLPYALGWHWSRWWLSSAIGMLVVAPMLVAWASPRPQPPLRGRRLMELLAVSLGTLAFSLPIFVGPFQHGFKSFLFSYMLLPFVVWTALRFGLRESTTLVFGITLISAWGTVNGSGPFALIDPPLNVATYWPFVVILATTALFLSTLQIERQRSETERKEGLWLLRAVVDALPAIVRVADHQARTLFLNRTQAEVLGIPIKEQLGKTCAELSSDVFSRNLTAHDLRVLSTREAIPFKEVIYPSDGRIWLQTNIPLSPRVGPSGSRGDELDGSGNWRALTVAFDVTALKEAETALDRSEARLRSILSTVDGWILTVDPKGVIRYTNRPFPEATVQEMLGSKVTDWVRGSMRAGFQGLLDATLAHRRGGSLEVQSAREPHWWMDCRVQPVFRDDQPVELILGILDIDKRKRAEAERERLLTEMQRMKNLESLGVLAGGIAHDFNNLLTGVIGNASLASMKLPENSEIQDFLKAIEQASEQAAELCQQMLAFAGKGQYVAASVDLSSLVRGLVKILRSQLPNQAEIELDLAEGMPEIRCDPTQLRRIVINLITNAADALDDGLGTIRLVSGQQNFARNDLEEGHWSERIEPGPYLFLEISDTGKGMDEETLGKIYEPFFSTKFMGRGLGLAAASGVMRSYSGSIQIVSTLGQGTTCRLLFPAREEEKPGIVEIDMSQAAETPGMILLADDEEVVAQVARQTLENAGYSVLLAQDGREAFDLFEQNKQDVAIAVLDMTMPEITGAELLRRFRRLRPELPVLLSSGFAEADLSSHLGDYRWTGFIKKPYRPQELLKAVYRALNEPAAPAAGLGFG